MCFWVRIFVYHCLTCWMSFSGLQLPTWLGLLVMASITWDDLCCESTHVENCLNELSPGVSFTFINHYLWNPQPLLVQYIGNINKFLWLSVFWLLCSNALELVHMKETHLKLLGMSVVGISQISAIYPLTYSQQLYLLLFMRHIALAHQITSHCLWDLVISCEFLQTICWSSFQVLVGTFSMHFEFLMKFWWCW